MPIAALPLKIDLTFNSGLLSDVFLLPFSVLRESSFDSSPGSRSVAYSSAEVGGSDIFAVCRKN